MNYKNLCIKWLFRCAKQNVCRKRKLRLIRLNCLCQVSALRNDIETKKNGDKNDEGKLFRSHYIILDIYEIKWRKDALKKFFFFWYETKKLAMFCPTKTTLQKSDLIYCLTCLDCNEKYIGKTDRNLVTLIIWTWFTWWSTHPLTSFKM